MGPRQSDHNSIKHNHIKQLQLNLHFCLDTFFDVAQWFLLKKNSIGKMSSLKGMSLLPDVGKMFPTKIES